MTTKETLTKILEELKELKDRVVEIERTLFNIKWEKDKEKTLYHLNKDKK